MDGRTRRDREIADKLTVLRNLHGPAERVIVDRVEETNSAFARAAMLPVAKVYTDVPAP